MDTFRGSGFFRLLTLCWIAACVESPVARGAEVFVPPNWPTDSAPVGWAGHPDGTRYEMPVFLEKTPAERRMIIVNVKGWTKESWEKEDMGSYAVGDQVHFSLAIGDRDSRFFGSMKDGRDGGVVGKVVRWMDEKGEKALSEEKTAVREACASCAGYQNLHFTVPTYARTGKHFLVLTYDNGKLGLKLSRTLSFHVTNDGSWEKNPVVDRLAAKYPSIIVLQNARPCAELGIGAFEGSRDMAMVSANPVADRRMDHCNMGKDKTIAVGSYGLEFRSLISFDLTKVPKDAVIEEAYLQLYAGAMQERSGSLTVRAFEVLKDWAEGRGVSGNYLNSKTAVLNGESTWQCSRFPEKWAKEGCGEPGKDRGEEPAGAAETIRQAKVWVSVPLKTELVSRWIRDPGSNRGVVLMDPKGSKAALYSSEFDDPAMRPKLIMAFSKGIAPPPPCAAGGSCNKP